MHQSKIKAKRFRDGPVWGGGWNHNLGAGANDSLWMFPPFSLAGDFGALTGPSVLVP